FPDADFADADTSPPNPWLDAATLDGGGPFLCFNCICDGTTRLCFAMAVGDVHGDANFDVCSDSSTSCISYPPACASDHSCACLADTVATGSCICQLDPTGSGLEVGCLLP